MEKVQEGNGGGMESDSSEPLPEHSDKTDSKKNTFANDSESSSDGGHRGDDDTVAAPIMPVPPSSEASRPTRDPGSSKHSKLVIMLPAKDKDKTCATCGRSPKCCVWGEYITALAPSNELTAEPINDLCKTCKDMLPLIDQNLDTALEAVRTSRLKKGELLIMCAQKEGEIPAPYHTSMVTKRQITGFKSKSQVALVLDSSFVACRDLGLPVDSVRGSDKRFQPQSYKTPNGTLGDAVVMTLDETIPADLPYELGTAYSKEETEVLEITVDRNTCMDPARAQTVFTTSMQQQESSRGAMLTPSNFTTAPTFAQWKERCDAVKEKISAEAKQRAQTRDIMGLGNPDAAEEDEHADGGDGALVLRVGDVDRLTMQSPDAESTPGKTRKSRPRVVGEPRIRRIDAANKPPPSSNSRWRSLASGQGKSSSKSGALVIESDEEEQVPVEGKSDSRAKEETGYNLDWLATLWRPKGMDERVQKPATAETARLTKSGQTKAAKRLSAWTEANSAACELQIPKLQDKTIPFHTLEKALKVIEKKGLQLPRTHQIYYTIRVAQELQRQQKWKQYAECIWLKYIDRSQDDQESMQIEQEELGKWTSDNAHLCNITPHNSDSQEIDVLPAAFKDCFFSDEFFQLTMNVKNMRNAFLEMLVAVLTQIEAAPLCKATQKDEIAMVLPVHWACLGLWCLLGRSPGRFKAGPPHVAYLVGSWFKVGAIKKGNTIMDDVSCADLLCPEMQQSPIWQVEVKDFIEHMGAEGQHAQAMILLHKQIADMILLHDSPPPTDDGSEERTESIVTMMDEYCIKVPSWKEKMRKGCTGDIEQAAQQLMQRFAAVLLEVAVHTEASRTNLKRVAQWSATAGFDDVRKEASDKLLAHQEMDATTTLLSMLQHNVDSIKSINDIKDAWEKAMNLEKAGDIWKAIPKALANIGNFAVKALRQNNPDIVGHAASCFEMLVPHDKVAFITKRSKQTILAEKDAFVALLKAVGELRSAMPLAQQHHKSGDRDAFRHAMEQLQLKLEHVKRLDLPKVKAEDFPLFPSCVNALAESTTALIDGSGTAGGFVGISMLMKMYVDDFGKDLDKDIATKSAAIVKIVGGHPTIEGIPWYEDSGESENFGLPIRDLEKKFNDNLLNADGPAIEAQANALQEASHVLLM